MLNVHDVTDFGLKQLDNAGYYLRRYGITDQVNRHNLIAIAMTEKARAQGELARWELRARIQRRRLEQLRAQMDARSEALIARFPAPLAGPLNRARRLVGGTH
ncbi:MAG: hypothetical protein SV765_07270 [Pseudomonadota bacterium]|nr:hypothetical protein [Pseudomonadales bacterium]MDY6919996.1 hypothetical protein [Pseudomonadota bacterium]